MEEDTKLALAALREHFDLVIDGNERRWRTVLDSQKEAIRVAADANDKRFTVLNGFREAMADQSARMITRSEFEASGQAQLEKIESHRVAMESRVEAEVKPLQARLEEVGRPNWALMTSMASAAFLVVAAVWMIIGLKIDATISPLNLEMGQIRIAMSTNAERVSRLDNLSTASTAADVASRADRQQLNDRMRAMEAANASRGNEMERVDGHLIEIETQFCAHDIIGNLMHANDLRVLSMLWRKVFNGSVYPTDNAYYPKVCNQNAQPVQKGTD